MRTLALGSMFLVLALVFVYSPVAAEVCMKKRVAVKNGKVNLARAVTVRSGDCESREEDISTPGRTHGFVKFKEDGTILSSGGTNVTSVTVERLGSGNYNVSFFGSFPELTAGDPNNINRIIALSSARPVARSHSQATTQGADPDSVGIFVTTWAEDGVIQDEAGAQLQFEIADLPPG